MSVSPLSARHNPGVPGYCDNVGVVLRSENLDDYFLASLVCDARHLPAEPRWECLQIHGDRLWGMPVSALWELGTAGG